MALNSLDDAIEFMEASQRTTSIRELDRLFWDRHSDVGARSAAYTQLNGAGQKSTLGPIVHNMPKLWFGIYQRRGFAKQDLAARHALATDAPFTWSEIEARARAIGDKGAVEVFAAAREVSIGEGFVVPAHSNDGRLAAIVYYGEVLSDDPEHRAMLQLVGFYYRIAFDRLYSKTKDLALDVLSDRQVECLKWAASGKSDWEIGEILGIAERTVVRHMQNAKSKLDVKNRTHAVAVAMQKGIIPVHW